MSEYFLVVFIAHKQANKEYEHDEKQYGFCGKVHSNTSKFQLFQIQRQRSEKNQKPVDFFKRNQGRQQYDENQWNDAEPKDFIIKQYGIDCNKQKGQRPDPTNVYPG